MIVLLTLGGVSRCKVAGARQRVRKGAFRTIFVLKAPFLTSARRPVEPLILSLLAGATLIGIPAVTTNPWVIGAVFFVGGAGIITWNVIVVSLRQRITPDHLLGRGTSSHRLVSWGTRPLGTVAGGLLAEAAGLRWVFAVMALVIVASLLGMRTLTDERMAAADVPS